MYFDIGKGLKVAETEEGQEIIQRICELGRSLINNRSTMK
jgi:hypothetical protein